LNISLKGKLAIYFEDKVKMRRRQKR